MDVIIGERGPLSDINLLNKQREKFKDNQYFQGDKADQGAERTSTPKKKPSKKEMPEEIKEQSSNCNSESDTVIENEDKSLLSIFLLGIIGGFLALLTPCVFPMIPLTVSFFTKKNKFFSQRFYLH